MLLYTNSKKGLVTFKKGIVTFKKGLVTFIKNAIKNKAVKKDIDFLFIKATGGWVGFCI